MKYVLTSFIKRIPREGFKSLSVPLLALVLVFLISIMGGVRERQAEELEYVIDNFDVRIEASHPISRETEKLHIDSRLINLFTNEDDENSLAGHLRDVLLRQNFVVYQYDIYEYMLALAEDDIPIYAPLPFLRVNGLSSLYADDLLVSPMRGVHVEFFDGYDYTILGTNEPVAIVSEDLLAILDESNELSLRIWLDPINLEEMEFSEFMDIFRYHADVTFTVVGIIHNASTLVVTPFTAITQLWQEQTGQSPSSVLLSAMIADNRKIPEFQQAATPYFVGSGILDFRRPFALTVFDSAFNDITRTLRENISLIDTMTPFIYVLSIAIGFLASFLLTRRRKPEFAIMRSIGVKKTDVFFGALTEQGILCLIGAILGCALYLITWGTFLPWVALLFTLFYTLGSAISAARAAGTDVLKILREKE